MRFSARLRVTKPICAGITGVSAAIGTWLGILSPIVGFTAAVVALATFVYGLIHKRNQVLRDSREWLKMHGDGDWILLA